MANSVELDEVWMERIVESVRDLKYGSVQIVVHDGKIVQIDRTERRRFEPSGSSVSELQDYKQVKSKS